MELHAWASFGRKKDTRVGYGEFLGDSYTLFWSYIDIYALYEFLSKKYRRWWWWRERRKLDLLVKQAEAIQMSKDHMDSIANPYLKLVYFLKRNWTNRKCAIYLIPGVGYSFRKIWGNSLALFKHME